MVMIILHYYYSKYVQEKVILICQTFIVEIVECSRCRITFPLVLYEYAILNWLGNVMYATLFRNSYIRDKICAYALTD